MDDNKWAEILGLSNQLDLTVYGPFPERGYRIVGPGWETYREKPDQVLDTLQFLAQGGQIQVTFLSESV